MARQLILQHGASSGPIRCPRAADGSRSAWRLPVTLGERLTEPPAMVEAEPLTLRPVPPSADEAS
jgi:hypothetical protein